MDDRDDERYLVWFEGKRGEEFSPGAWTTLAGAVDHRDLYRAEDYSARILKVSVVDDMPVAHWVFPPLNVEAGLYRVFWRTGGSSLAAVGVTPNGGRWLAPVNWVKPSNSFDEWDQIDRMERIDTCSSGMSEQDQEALRKSHADLSDIPPTDLARYRAGERAAYATAEDIRLGRRNPLT